MGTWPLVVPGMAMGCGTFDIVFATWYENHTLLKYQENNLKEVPIKWIFHAGLLVRGEHNKVLNQPQCAQWV